MIQDAAADMLRRLEQNRFEIAYKAVGYFRAESAAREYRKALLREWENLSLKLGAGSALKVMAKRHDYELPKQEAKQAPDLGLKFGPECGADWMRTQAEDIAVKYEAARSGKKSAENAARFMRNARDEAVRFVSLYANESADQYGRYMAIAEYKNLVDQMKAIATA